MRLFGSLLVLFGVILLVFGGLTLFIPSDVIDMGAFSITIWEDMVVPLPPILGLICLLIGVIMLTSAPVAAPPPPY